MTVTIILSLVLMGGAIMAGAYDGIQKEFGLWQFFLRFAVMQLLLKTFDILFFDWVLLCRFSFFSHYYPEVKDIYGPEIFGYNKKAHLHGINGARGFWQAFWQIYALAMAEGLFDRFFIDWYWVGHTKAWTIPGTEDLKPYIPRKTLIVKWMITIVGNPVIAAVFAGIMYPLFGRA